MKNRLPFKILYEDAGIIVIDKPAGLLTTHTRLRGRAARESQLTAENLLNDYVRKGQAKSRKRVFLVHRLDRETSGVMMFAKSEELADWYRSNWSELTEKTYIAKVEGKLEADEGRFESYLKDDERTKKVRSVGPGEGGKLAITEWRKAGDHLEVKIFTGRKNQIRVQFAESGHPVVGDVKYGAKKADRLYLHAKELKVRLRSGDWKTFASADTKWGATGARKLRGREDFA